MAPVNYSKYVRPAITVAVLITTVVVFVVYLGKHPEVWHALRHVKLATFILLLALFGVFTVTLAWVQITTAALCGTYLRNKENLLLTIYSSIVNFFGPLQSGPGFRAIYLKKRHGTKLKSYTLATLFFLGFYALFSGVFLLSGLVGWWGMLGIVGLVLGGLALALRIPHPFIQSLRSLKLRLLGWLALATLAQVLVISLLYFTELKSINSHITYSQALIYTGAANFALFVSLTPGAIGFRESFLLFSRDLHHINSSTIASASLLDRAAYLVLLGILFLIVITVHATDYLQVRRIKQSP